MPALNVQAIAALCALLACYIGFHAAPGPAKGFRGRSGRYRHILLRGGLWMGLPALLALLLIGQLSAILVAPQGLRDLLPARLGGGDGRGDLLVAAAAGLAGGILATSLIARIKGGHGWTLGKVTHLLPQLPGEAAAAALLSIGSALVEECYFRAALPIAMHAVTGDAMLAMVLATLLFAGAHRYQGRTGMLGTGVAGMVFGWLYLASGSLLVPIAVHALLNLSSLVLRPWLAGTLLR